MSEDTHSHRWSSHDVISYKPLHSHGWYSVYEASTILWMKLLSLPWPCWWLDQHHRRELQPLWFLTWPLELEEDMMWNKLKWACKWAPTSHPLFIDLWNLITLFKKNIFISNNHKITSSTNSWCGIHVTLVCLHRANQRTSVVLMSVCINNCWQSDRYQLSLPTAFDSNPVGWSVWPVTGTNLTTWRL
jgi:hypothetical protein